MKKMWEGINQLIGPKKKNSKLLTTLKSPNSKGLTQNPFELTDILNRYHTSVDQKLYLPLIGTSVSILVMKRILTLSFSILLPLLKLNRK